jgi:short-subunit dehydrogenase
MPRRQLAEKRVIITGASSGIGWHLALQLAQHGCRMIVCARRKDRLDELATRVESAGGECVVVAGDICDPATRKNLLDRSSEHFGGVDVLINNAGIGAMGRFDDANSERLRKIFEVNFFAMAELIRESLPMLKQGDDPVIVNMNSVLGHRATPLKSEYCASKFAVHGLSDAIRAELSSDGIDLLLVSPSTTDSEFFDSAIEDETGKNWKKSGAMPPETVAAKTIRAMQKRRHEIILTFGGRIIVWLDRIIPGIANRLVARFGQ